MIYSVNSKSQSEANWSEQFYLHTLIRLFLSLDNIIDVALGFGLKAYKQKTMMGLWIFHRDIPHKKNKKRHCSN